MNERVRAVGAALMLVPHPHRDRAAGVAARLDPTAVLVTASGVLFLIGVNTTAINTALNAIAGDLAMSTGEVSWSVGIYMLAVASFVVLGGRLGDLLGERKVVVAGLGVFAVGAVIVAAGGSAPVAILGRAVQGLGGALLMPATMAVLRIAYPPERQGFALGVWGAVGGAAFALGPLIGGLLTDSAGWRWIWWGSAIACGVLFVLALRSLAAMPRPSERPRFDKAGIALLPIALFGLILAVQQGPVWGWGSARTIASFVVSLTAFVALIAVELRREEPLLHLALLRVRELVAANLGTFANTISLIGVLYFFNLYAQSVFGFDQSALTASAALLPYGAGMFAASMLIGRICDRLGFRWPVAIGLALLTVGALLSARIDAGDGYGSLWWCTLIQGVGVGITMSAPSAAGLRAMPAARAGEASGIINVVRYLSAALVVSLGSISFVAAGSAELAGPLERAGVSQPERTVLDDALTGAPAQVATAEAELDSRQLAAFRAGAPAAVTAGYSAVMLGLAACSLLAAAGWIVLMRPARE